MKNWLWQGMLATVIAVPALSGAARAGGSDDFACSNATLRGDYAFAIEGQTLGIVDTPNNQLLPAPISVNGVAMTWFDGKGGLSQVDYVMKGGTKRPGNGADNGFDSGETGTYQIFPDCTGTFQVDFGTQNYLVTRFVVAGRSLTGQASTIHTVVSEQHVPGPPPAGPPRGTPVGSLTCTAATGCDLLVQIRSDGHALDGQ
jgi:hypothetical protein